MGQKSLDMMQKSEEGHKWHYRESVTGGTIEMKRFTGDIKWERQITGMFSDTACKR